MKRYRVEEDGERVYGASFAAGGFSRSEVLAALEASGGNLLRAAEALDVCRMRLYRHVRRYRLWPELHAIRERHVLGGRAALLSAAERTAAALLPGEEAPPAPRIARRPCWWKTCRAA